MKDGAAERRVKRSSSPSILAGRLFDDRGNPMTPTHANKKGVRYRYYTSHALLQGRKSEAGSVSRVFGPEIEQAISDALRAQLGVTKDAADDRILIDCHLARATITTGRITIERLAAVGELDEAGAPEIVLPFAITTPRQKGIARTPTILGAISDGTRLDLLMAIARSKRWLDQIATGAATDFDAIARDEKLVERHVRYLAPLAFRSPRIVEAIAEGRAPRGITVSILARNLPLAWSRQKQQFGLNAEAS